MLCRCMVRRCTDIWTEKMILDTELALCLMGKSVRVNTALLFWWSLNKSKYFIDQSGHCPLKNSVSKCTPRCVSDYQCSMNEKCCPNKCGSTSCVEASAISTGSGYKGSQNGEKICYFMNIWYILTKFYFSDAVYCGGVKCGPYQKCQFDRSTKREKCVRTWMNAINRI